MTVAAPPVVGGRCLKPRARASINRMVASLSNLRVLVAEDENLSRRLLVNALESWGYSVAVACNGEEAWEQLSAPDAPPLVLLDWMMPASTAWKSAVAFEPTRRGPTVTCSC